MAPISRIPSILCTVWLFWICCFISISQASSVARNQLQYLEYIDNPTIHTHNGRVSHLSEFDLEFELGRIAQRIRLSLEPNHDVIPQDAWVNYLSDDGSIAWSEPIERHDHKIFKGQAMVYDEIEDFWEEAGWARIIIHRDGLNPLFEGAFTILDDSHHIQLPSSYGRTKHPLDPHLDVAEDESMLLFRDSDVAPHSLATRETSKSCVSDELDFNSRSDHPIRASTMKRAERSWGAMPVTRLFGKRQIDSQGSGNTGGANLASTIGQGNGCPNTKKVALMGVAADCTFAQQFNSTESMRSMIIRTVNSASSVWEHTFNISLGLRNLTVMPSNCPGDVQQTTQWNQDCNAAGVDINARLNLFSQWRGTLGDSNTFWSLFTACTTGPDVGLAWLGQACVTDAFTSNTSTGGTEYVSGTNVVALSSTDWQILAHETGHTFGAVHDCTSQTCADPSIVDSQQCCPLSGSTCNAGDQYIMNPYVASGITAFSQCTLGNICSAMLRNSVNSTCLSPNTDVTTITGSQCGNGIVEKGEECDCGGIAGCKNDTCCDPTTCKFINNAVCDDANEDCCTNCQFTSQGSICRASTGVCDPAEMCTGSSGTCPPDELAPNGQPCTLSNTTDTSLACASGQCTSRNLQCQTAMGSYEASGSFGHSVGSPNDTYACSDLSCTLECSSPSFGANTCVDFNSNFLDGTPCGGGGTCANGQCQGSSVSKEINSWIEDHKGLVIGVAIPVGLLLLGTITVCLWGCCRGRRQRKEMQQMKIGTEPPSPQDDYMNNPGWMGWYAPRRAPATQGWTTTTTPYSAPPPFPQSQQQRNIPHPPPPKPESMQNPAPFKPTMAATGSKNNNNEWDWIHGRGPNGLWSSSSNHLPQEPQTKTQSYEGQPRPHPLSVDTSAHNAATGDDHPDLSPVSPVHTTGPPQTQWLYGSGILGARTPNTPNTPLPPYSPSGSTGGGANTGPGSTNHHYYHGGDNGGGARYA